MVANQETWGAQYYSPENSGAKESSIKCFVAGPSRETCTKEEAGAGCELAL